MSQKIVYGLHAVEAVLRHHPQRLIEIYALKGRDDQRLGRLVDKARQLGIAIQWSQRQALDAKAGDSHHQGVVARVKPAPQYTEADLKALLDNSPEPFLLLLDGITDPHNLGACLRNADAAGVDAVIVPKDKAARITATVRKVAVGAAETVPFVSVTNLARTMKWLQQQGVWLVGTAGEADCSLFDADLRGPIGLVMGAEGKGMRRLTRQHCDLLVSLPMAGHVDSLNVAVATGICLFEVVRQRHHQRGSA